MNTRLAAYGALSLAIALVAGTAGWVITRDSGGPDCPGLAVAGGGEIGGPFTLMSETGAEVTEADVITGPTLIYFGYTFCPDVCPLDTVRNAQAVDILAERGIAVKPVFISVDHGRDTAETMDDFTANVHPDLLGLTGTEEQIRAAAKAYRYVYQVQDEGDPDYYLINHMTLSYLMTPEDGFVTAFTRDLSPEQLAEQAACHLGAR